jgi:Tat protein translocase TatB subunit
LFGIGGWELLMIAVVALIVLGPKGLPAAARAIGRAVSELRRATSDLRQSIELDPELKDIPNALDELNRPLLSASPYPRKRVPRDGPPPGLKDPPKERDSQSARGGEAGEGDAEKPSKDKVDAPSEASETTPRQQPTVEKTSTKPVRAREPDEPPQHVDEPDGRDG